MATHCSHLCKKSSKRLYYIERAILLGKEYDDTTRQNLSDGILKIYLFHLHAIHV